MSSAMKHPNHVIVQSQTQAQGLLDKAKRANAADRVSRALASADLPRLQQAVKAAERVGLTGEMVDKCRQAAAICTDLRGVIDCQVGRESTFRWGGSNNRGGGWVSLFFSLFIPVMSLQDYTRASEAVKAWEQLMGGGAGAVVVKGTDYEAAKEALKHMRRDHKGQRAWRTSDASAQSPQSTSPRVGVAALRPSSALTLTSPVCGGSLIGTLGSPGSPAAVFARPRTAAVGSSGRSPSRPVRGGGALDTITDDGGEDEAAASAQRREELQMVGARTYEHWLAEKALQVSV